MSGRESKNRQDLKQERMRFAYQVLSGYVKNPKKKELAAALKSLPISLRQNGLATVAARMAAEENRSLGDSLLGKWLLRECPVLQGMQPQVDNTSMRALIDWCLKMDRRTYQAVQNEAMQLLEQAKLIGAALWPKEAA